ncbi:MAG: phosphotransferase family protein [Microthrixaceae bacterium]|nr:phosphotransferase family protein [Microthrixaceae bacterium]
MAPGDGDAEDPAQEPSRAGGGPRPEVLGAVAEALRPGHTGAEEVRIVAVERLSGGASRLTWSVLADPGGEVILQQERAGSAGANLPMGVQAELLRRAAELGVPVPQVIAQGGVPGEAFVVLTRVEGESVPSRIRAEPGLAAGLEGLAFQVGRACARVHAMDPTGIEEHLAAPDPIESMRTLLDHLGEPHPVFEAAIVELGRSRPPARRPAVVHGDLRMGNLLVSGEGMTAVLDWELAHMSSPVEDLGWFCARAWRFGSPLHAGGVGTLEELLEGYAAGGGTPPDSHELRWWEAYACLRWGLICVLQASVHLNGLHRSAELAAIGRRAAECEEDLLEILWGPSDQQPPPEPDDLRLPPHDAPGGGELLTAVREGLEAMRARSSGAERFELRVAVNALEVVRRELAFGDLLQRRHAARLSDLGVADDAELSTRIRQGSTDPGDRAVRRALRAMVRDKLAVSNPGYWDGDGPR